MAAWQSPPKIRTVVTSTVTKSLGQFCAGADMLSCQCCCADLSRTRRALLSGGSVGRPESTRFMTIPAVCTSAAPSRQAWGRILRAPSGALQCCVLKRPCWLRCRPRHISAACTRPGAWHGTPHCTYCIPTQEVALFFMSIPRDNNVRARPRLKQHE
jgi:hypothetical protein